MTSKNEFFRNLLGRCPRRKGILVCSGNPSWGRNLSRKMGLYGNRSVLDQEEAMEKILCVDDDPTILLLYKEEFSQEGYEVILANSGKEALRQYRAERPQLVIMDLLMPGMDGIEALTSILGIDRQASIIINTSYSQHRDNFLTWPAEAYLIKSSDLGELKRKVRETLDKRQFGKAA